MRGKCFFFYFLKDFGKLFRETIDGNKLGRVAEWPNASVSKTDSPAMVT